MDNDFATALEHSMPQAMGLGIDRLIILLTGANLKYSRYYPFTPPKFKAIQRGVQVRRVDGASDETLDTLLKGTNTL